VWRFSSHRMIAEYVTHCYVPAAGATTSSFGAADCQIRESGM
jgi:hypothetical protein